MLVPCLRAEEKHLATVRLSTLATCPGPLGHQSTTAALTACFYPLEDEKEATNRFLVSE